jgi:hypothetical protein
MKDPERRRLQLYAKTMRLALLRKRIDVLEELLGPLYLEVEQIARDTVDGPVKARTPKRRRR